jgi:hypothetical protein
MFYAQGVYNARTATKSFQLARSVEGELRFAEGSTPEAITPSTTCRFIFLIADMRLDWLISIPDPTHPHFLPLEKIAAARRYNWWLGVQELSHDFTEIEQLDAQLMFERFNGNWDFDMAVPPMLLTTISQRRPTDSQQCLICHTLGHCIDQCAKVTGIALLRRTNDKSEEHHAAYDDDENDAENDKDEREVCGIGTLGSATTTTANTITAARNVVELTRRKTAPSEI